MKPRILFYSHGGVSTDAEALISRITENTKTVTDAALHALKTEKTMEAASYNISEYLHSHFGAELESFEKKTIARGYAMYFRKKGLA